MRTRIYLLLPVALLVNLQSLHAQNELVPAPNAVQLQRVWTREGEPLTADEYGKGLWGGLDLSGDAIADFAVYRGSDNTWLFYEGANPPDTVPFMVRDSLARFTPVVGDFFGNGSLSMAFVRGRSEVINETTYFFYSTNLYAFTNPGLAEEPHDTTELRALLQVYAGDLDRESGDELVLVDKFDGSDQPGRILIYKGGSEFQLDVPTVIIYDSGSAVNNAPSNWEVRFSDFDGDGRIDMAMGGSYPTGGPMLRFYWGDNESPWSWAQRPPDRDLPLGDGVTGMKDVQRFGFFDLDDDPGAGIVGYTGGSVAGTHVYLSSRANARTRSFNVADADVSYPGLGFSTTPIGYLNDSLRRYEMLPMGGTVQGNQIARLAVSGSSYGPNDDYEAWYAPGLDGLGNEFIFQQGAAVGDVTGDGYGDMLYSDWTYGPFVNTGIAFILSGGSEIPLDDTTLSVQEYPVAGESGGLYLWPNPVLDELHIAWKGNLKKKPARFAVYDMMGREVVSGEVDPYRGAAVWLCGSVAVGTYLVVAYDANGEAIATAKIVKQ